MHVFFRSLFVVITFSMMATGAQAGILDRLRSLFRRPQTTTATPTNTPTQPNLSHVAAPTVPSPVEDPTAMLKKAKVKESDLQRLSRYRAMEANRRRAVLPAAAPATSDTSATDLLLSFEYFWFPGNVFHSLIFKSDMPAETPEVPARLQQTVDAVADNPQALAEITRFDEEINNALNGSTAAEPATDATTVADDSTLVETTSTASEVTAPDTSATDAPAAPSSVGPVADEQRFTAPDPEPPRYEAPAPDPTPSYSEPRSESHYSAPEPYSAPDTSSDYGSSSSDCGSSLGGGE